VDYESEMVVITIVFAISYMRVLRQKMDYKWLTTQHTSHLQLSIHCSLTNFLPNTLEVQSAKMSNNAYMVSCFNMSILTESALSVSILSNYAKSPKTAEGHAF
jgi:hypothetical protein